MPPLRTVLPGIPSLENRPDILSYSTAGSPARTAEPLNSDCRHRIQKPNRAKFITKTRYRGTTNDSGCGWQTEGTKPAARFWQAKLAISLRTAIICDLARRRQKRAFRTWADDAPDNPRLLRFQTYAPNAYYEIITYSVLLGREKAESHPLQANLRSFRPVGSTALAAAFGPESDALQQSVEPRFHSSVLIRSSKLMPGQNLQQLKPRIRSDDRLLPASWPK